MFKFRMFSSVLVVHHERPKSGLDLSWNGTAVSGVGVQQVNEPREYVYTYM